MPVSLISNETINKRRVDRPGLMNLADEGTEPKAPTVPTVPSGPEVNPNIYEPALHWLLIVFITFMSIMLLLVGVLMGLREFVFEKTSERIPDRGYQPLNRVVEFDGDDN